MRASAIVLIGLGASAIYAIASQEIVGECRFELSIGLGVVVTIALSGFVSWHRRDSGSRSSRASRKSRSVAPLAAPKDEAVYAKDDAKAKRPTAGKVKEAAADSPTMVAVEPELEINHPVAVPPILVSEPEQRTALPQWHEDAETLWQRACKIRHNEIPNANEDAMYLDLVITAAERGHVSALAKLGEYAYRRGALVEAYFWTKMAHRRLELSENRDKDGLKQVSDFMRVIRRKWITAGRPQEYDNVYNNFPEERGELGRAFLRLDNCIEADQTRKYLKALAERGNPDAALFV